MIASYVGQVAPSGQRGAFLAYIHCQFICQLHLFAAGILYFIFLQDSGQFFRQSSGDVYDVCTFDSTHVVSAALHV